jgi:hypothetical protein
MGIKRESKNFSVDGASTVYYSILSMLIEASRPLSSDR